MKELADHLTGFLWAITPAVFAAGGVYALFRWRLEKVEKIVEKLADTCIANRAKCLFDFGVKLDKIEGGQEEHWVELHKKLSNIDKFMGRVEQYMIMKNGGIARLYGDTNEDNR